MGIDKKQLAEIENRFSERSEYLSRDLDMIIKNLNDIKDSVVNLSTEIENMKKNS
jgi:hypothetical protein